MTDTTSIGIAECFPEYICAVDLPRTGGSLDILIISFAVLSFGGILMLIRNHR